jgi:signal transduction histidine kinase
MPAIPRAQLESIAAVLRESLAPVIVVDEICAVAFANRAACERWPQASPAAAGFPEPDRARFIAEHARVMASGAAVHFDWGDRGPGGVRAWFRCNVSPIRRDSTVVGTLCWSSEITDFKRLEERLRRSEQLMVDAQGLAHMGIWDWDVSEPHATWSPELYRIYDLDPDSYVPSYESYLKLVHPDDRQRVIDATNRVFQEHVPYSHDERIFRRDGSMRYLHTWAYPVLDDSGALRRLVGVCQDITDRKLAEEQVRELALDLERRVAERTRTIENSMRDLEAFNAMISHDLRAPLQVINMCAQLIGRALPQRPMEARPHLERIERAVGQMTAQVDALLALARVGSQPLAHSEVDLSSLARELLVDLERAMGGHRVDAQIAPDLRCSGDPRLLRAVMQNLLENALKYSRHADRPRIEVGTVDGERGIAFFVRDNGIGFAMDDAHRLFAPFERLPAAAEFPGNGIGLATVHRILERHRGQIWAESEPGRGATFFFQLPA